MNEVISNWTVENLLLDDLSMACEAEWHRKEGNKLKRSSLHLTLLYLSQLSQKNDAVASAAERHVTSRRVSRIRSAFSSFAVSTFLIEKSSSIKQGNGIFNRFSSDVKPSSQWGCNSWRRTNKSCRENMNNVQSQLMTPFVCCTVLRNSQQFLLTLSAGESHFR